MESLGGGSITFFKFRNPGDFVDGIFESLAFDQDSKYGKESVVRVVTAQGETVQYRLATSLISTFKAAAPRLVPGKTRLVVRYLGMKSSKKDPSKTYKAFDVQAEGLLPKTAAANIAGAAAILGDAQEAPGGDTSFDPSKLS